MSMRLRVLVHDARDLKLPFGTLSADVFCMVTSAGVQQTTCICKSVDSLAIWDERFDFDLVRDWETRQSLRVEIFHSGLLRERVIAETHFPLRELLRRENMRQCAYFPLHRPGSAKSSASASATSNPNPRSNANRSTSTSSNPNSTLNSKSTSTSVSGRLDAAAKPAGEIRLDIRIVPQQQQQQQQQHLLSQPHPMQHMQHMDPYMNMNMNMNPTMDQLYGAPHQQQQMMNPMFPYQQPQAISQAQLDPRTGASSIAARNAPPAPRPGASSANITASGAAPPPSSQSILGGDASCLAVGELLDNKYRIKELLGKGNFGTTYLAVSDVDDQTYAVKLILCKHDSELATVKAEAKILFGMLHDNIVRYFSSFIHIDRLHRKFFAMVMEYCENRDIQSHIRHYRRNGQRVSDRRVLRWTLEIAEALAYMHAKNLQHRDLKADNVLVKGDTAKVADFGLATAKGSMRGQVGALAYESPEQASHQPYDGRNDIWALGCLVTEMLTGQMVYRRVKSGAVFAMDRQAVDATIKECAVISDDWGRLVQWLLNVDVTLRPTANFVVETLRPIVKYMYETAPEEPVPEHEQEAAAAPAAAKSSVAAPSAAGGGEDDPHGDGPPPAYDQATAKPRKAPARPAGRKFSFPGIVMTPTPPPKKEETHRPKPPPLSRPHIGRMSSGAVTAPPLPPKSNIEAISQPPQHRVRSLPPAPATHRAPWMEEVEMCLVTYYSRFNPEGISRVEQKVRDLLNGVVTVGQLEHMLQSKYGEPPGLLRVQITRPVTIEVTIPQGCGAGTTLAVKSPHTGRELRVTVPPDHAPGMILHVMEEVPLPQY